MRCLDGYFFPPLITHFFENSFEFGVWWEHQKESVIGELTSLYIERVESHCKLHDCIDNVSLDAVQCHHGAVE